MAVDIIYLAWNRLEFTAKSFRLLIANTDWDLVHQLYVFDDGSSDGTREFLDEEIRTCPAEHALVHCGWHSPPATMNFYIENNRLQIERFAKVDSDCCVPPGWLNRLTETMDENPSVELLGSEAGMTEVAGRDGKTWDGSFRVEPCSHIGGIGLMKMSAFTSRRRLYSMGRFGFTEWQHEFQPVRGWITPDLPMPLLDRMPIEPWRSLSDRYIERGWQREGSTYDPTMMEWAYSWML